MKLKEGEYSTYSETKLQMDGNIAVFAGLVNK